MAATLSRNEELVRLYVDEEWSLVDLAKHYHCHHSVVNHWLQDLGVTLRTRGEAAEIAAERRAMATTQEGMVRCACGILIPAGQTQCELCAGIERETERQAEEALFSSAAFLGNPRNIGRYDPATVGHITGVIPRW